MKEIKSSDNFKLIISKNLSAEINYLHKKVGAKEWCGNLYYKILSGDISNPKSWIFYADKMYFMDKGEPATTSFKDKGKEVQEGFMLLNPEGDHRIGLIHSHQNMGCFFSSVDNEELRDNCIFTSLYLSLIVNFACDPKAKIAIYMSAPKSKKGETRFENSDNSIYIEDATVNSIQYTLEGDVEYEVEDTFEARFLQKDKEVKVYNSSSYSSNSKFDWEEFHKEQNLEKKGKYGSLGQGSKKQEFRELGFSKNQEYGKTRPAFEQLDEISNLSVEDFLHSWIYESFTFQKPQDIKEAIECMEAELSKNSGLFQGTVQMLKRDFLRRIDTRFKGNLLIAEYEDIIEISKTYLKHHFAESTVLKPLLNIIGQQKEELSGITK